MMLMCTIVAETTAENGSISQRSIAAKIQRQLHSVAVDWLIDDRANEWMMIDEWVVCWHCQQTNGMLVQ